MKGFTEPKPARLLSGESLRKTPFDSWTTLWSRKMNFKKEKLCRFPYIEPDFFSGFISLFFSFISDSEERFGKQNSSFLLNRETSLGSHNLFVTVCCEFVRLTKGLLDGSTWFKAISNWLGVGGFKADESS